jgi:hypothetical protein
MGRTQEECAFLTELKEQSLLSALIKKRNWNAPGYSASYSIFMSKKSMTEKGRTRADLIE